MYPENELVQLLAADNETPTFQQSFVFKQRLTSKAKGDPLDDFIALLANKPDGYWLIRESRVEGMISITYRLQGMIGNIRFVFQNNSWSTVGTNELNSYLEAGALYEHITSETVINKLDLLLDTIYKVEPSLLKSRILLPEERQRSSNPSYLETQPYIMGETRNGTTEKIYADPVKSLEQIQGILNGILTKLKNSNDPTQAIQPYSIEQFDDIHVPLSREQLDQQRIIAKPFKDGEHVQEFMGLKNLFASWLETNKLTTDLICPVTLDLFEEPYYILETGHVYDQQGLFPNNKLLAKCPVTKIDIDSHPVHCAGYRTKLSECLVQFFEVIELVQKQLAPNEKASSFSPAFFPPLLAFTSPFVANDPVPTRAMGSSKT